MATSPKDAFYSYLVAFSYWCGIAFAATILLMIFHATHARWMTILRRPVEAMGVTIPVFILLVIPIWLGMKQLYSWVDPVAAGFTGEALSRVTHKGRWLSVNFFIVRSVVYILVAALLGWRLFGLSLRQDKEGGTDLLARQRRFASGRAAVHRARNHLCGLRLADEPDPTWFSTSSASTSSPAASAASALDLGDRDLAGAPARASSAAT